MAALVAAAVAAPARARAEPTVRVAITAPELDAAARGRHVAAMRAALADTAIAATTLDVSIARLEIDAGARFVDVRERVRVVACDARGTMLSIVEVGATVHVPRRAFRRAHLDALRAEALADAGRRIAAKLGARPTHPSI